MTPVMRPIVLGLLALILGGSGVASAADAPAERARAVLEASGLQGGVVVHLGCGDGRMTVALRASDAFVVQGLARDEGAVRKARAHIREHGLYGPVSVVPFGGGRLPYVGNLVTLVVADDLGGVPMTDVMRVLAPGGVAMIGGKKTVKPRPDTMDDWPQYLRGADNNAVSRDAAVGPPRHLQWVTDPSWSRSHMSIPTVISLVTTGGRLFTVEDTATLEDPFLPGRWALVARDAFNGVRLWQYPYANWEPVTRYVKDIAIQLQRRLVAAGDTVYCTPGLEAPLMALDAATGKVRKTYANTARTQEFAYAGGVLYLVIGDRMNAARYNIVKTYSGKGQNLGGSDPEAPFGGTGWRGSYAPETPDKEDTVCDLVALDADTGRTRWRITDVHNYTAASLAVRGDHAVYQTAGGFVCLDAGTGKMRWQVKKPIKGGDGTEANTVILTDDTAYAQEGSRFIAYDLADGAEKWAAPIAPNCEKAADLFVAAGAVWTGGSKPPTRYDPRTGKQTATYRQRMTGPMGHDRCYRNFITERFYINSKTGGADFVALEDGQEFPHHWTRGTCGLGVVPANGLLYAPPYSCQCSIGAMVKDFNALYTEPGLEKPDQPIPVEPQVRLIKGPAYGAIENQKSKIEDDASWPTYRHDGTRGGATPSTVPTNLAPLWTAKVTTHASPPVVADGRVYVADVDAHTLLALNAADGRVAWDYVAGSRIDSPPTVHAGLVLFGSRDGWVHCLRASDGELVWRFKDLPERTIGAFGQLESAWPVCGSVLVLNGVAYAAAGRSSFLDGGICLYGLDPQTGKVAHRRHVYGPFDAKTGFPAVQNRGFKGDILVTDGKRLYLRHKAFEADLSDAASPAPHLIASAGFIDDVPQHRTYWALARGFQGKTAVRGARGDILATDGKNAYEVRGFPVHRHSYFDPRLKGYLLLGGPVPPERPAAKGKKGRKGRQAGGGDEGDAGRWGTHIPLTGKAMVLASDVVFVAGTPAYFPPKHTAEQYEAGFEGRLGGVLWAASTEDGRKLAEYKLEAAPAWDGMAAAGGRLYVALADGRLVCLGKK